MCPPFFLPPGKNVDIMEGITNSHLMLQDESHDEDGLIIKVGGPWVTLVKDFIYCGLLMWGSCILFESRFFCGGFFVLFFFCFDYKPTCILCNVFLEPYCEFIFFGSSVIYQKLWVLRDWEYRSRDWKHHCRHWTLGLTVFYYGINKHENQHEAYEYQLQWRGIVIYGLNRKFCP